MATVLIVSRTKMRDGVCVGGIIEDSLEFIRVLDERGYKLTKDAPYQIGDRWEMEIETPKTARDIPHSEDRQVHPIQRIDNIATTGVRDFIKSQEFGTKVIDGHIASTFEGCLKFDGYKNFVNHDKIPSFSTQFWIPDRDLNHYYDEKYDKHLYYYNGYRIKFVGHQDPIDVIPKGSLVRISLADWWGGDGSGEDRCYLQLSGWYL